MPVRAVGQYDEPLLTVTGGEGTARPLRARGSRLVGTVGWWRKTLALLVRQGAGATRPLPNAMRGGGRHGVGVGLLLGPTGFPKRPHLVPQHHVVGNGGPSSRRLVTNLFTQL